MYIYVSMSVTLSAPGAIRGGGGGGGGKHVFKMAS